MKAIISCIENLRIQLDRHRKADLKEYPTQTIFIDPLLKKGGAINVPTYTNISSKSPR